MLMAMNKKVNLTGIKDGEESLIKNIYDSMTVYDPAYFPQNGRVLDLGTGAGFPGVPLAILRPDMYVVLVDSIQKKLTFIEDACRELGIRNVKCVHIRAEEGGRRRKTRESFDVVTARAVKALEEKKELTLPAGDQRVILYIRKTAPCPKTYPRKVGIAEKKPIIGE